MVGSAQTRRRQLPQTTGQRVATAPDGRRAAQQAAETTRPDGRNARRRPDLNAQLLVRLNAADLEWFRRQALPEPMSELVRGLLLDYMRRNGRTPATQDDPTRA